MQVGQVSSVSYAPTSFRGKLRLGENADLYKQIPGFDAFCNLLGKKLQALPEDVEVMLSAKKPSQLIKPLNVLYTPDGVFARNAHGDLVRLNEAPPTRGLENAKTSQGLFGSILPTDGVTFDTSKRIQLDTTPILSFIKAGKVEKTEGIDLQTFENPFGIDTVKAIEKWADGIKSLAKKVDFSVRQHQTAKLDDKPPFIPAAQQTDTARFSAAAL